MTFLVITMLVEAVAAFFLIYKLEQMHREERNELHNRLALKGQAVIRPPSERTPLAPPPEEDDFNRVGAIVTGEPIQ